MLEDLLKPQPKTPQCQVAETAKTLETIDRQILLSAVADKGWPITALHIALRNKGIKIAEKRLYDHRNEVCPCSKN